jgi:hypothetical protein
VAAAVIVGVDEHRRLQDALVCPAACRELNRDLSVGHRASGHVDVRGRDGSAVYQVGVYAVRLDVSAVDVDFAVLQVDALLRAVVGQLIKDGLLSEVAVICANRGACIACRCAYCVRLGLIRVSLRGSGGSGDL